LCATLLCNCKSLKRASACIFVPHPDKWMLAFGCVCVDDQTGLERGGGRTAGVRQVGGGGEEGGVIL
jgi:hypothetical protein